MKDYRLRVLQMVSVLPSKVSVTTDISKQYRDSSGNWIFREKKPVSNVSNEKKLVRKFHNFDISVNSARNLRKKIDFLYYYSNARRVKTYSGKVISNFKVLFLTLTIPSQQIHNTGMIITNILDPFLQICRQRLKMQNYVWRLEFQANGNAHFHILTDTYIDYYFAKKHWNKCLNNLGYIDAYRAKMEALSYNDYCQAYGKDYKGNKVSNDVLFKRYNAGKSTNWKNPNSVDVKSIRSSREISFYISKYFSKKDKGQKCNALDNEENSFALRLCYWSRSLSRLELESMPYDYYDADFVELLEADASVIRCVYDYCVVYYYDIATVGIYLKKAINAVLERVRLEADYIPAG